MHAELSEQELAQSRGSGTPSNTCSSHSSVAREGQRDVARKTTYLPNEASLHHLQTPKTGTSSKKRRRWDLMPDDADLAKDGCKSRQYVMDFLERHKKDVRITLQAQQSPPDKPLVEGIPKVIQTTGTRRAFCSVCRRSFHDQVDLNHHENTSRRHARKMKSYKKYFTQNEDPPAKKMRVSKGSPSHHHHHQHSMSMSMPILNPGAELRAVQERLKKSDSSSKST